MTLTETLERLAVVAPEWIRYDDEAYMYFIKGWDNFDIWVGEPDMHNFTILDNKKDQAIFFGAICEKCEAESWRWSLPNTGAKYSFVIWGTGINTPPHGLSENHPAHAAAQALLAAYEAWVPDCTKCNGKGRIHGDMGYCPTCDGTGKQLEVAG